MTPSPILNTILLTLSNGLLLVFCTLMLFGLYGFIKFKTSYGRILNTSKMDSVAAIFFMAALILRAPALSIALKLFVALVFYLLTNPVVNQLITYVAKKNEEDQALLERRSLL